MKKLLLSLSLLLIMGLFAQQTQAQSRTGFGIRGGVNFASLNDVDESPDSRTGFMVGLYANYFISDSPVSIQPEVLYTQKGFESGDATFELDYIEVPVLAKFDFVTDGQLRPYVYAGPSVGFSINTEIDGDPDDFFGDDPDTDINDEAINDTEFGVVVGAGLDFGSFDIGARYGAGLTEVFDGPNSAKNGVFSITVGVGI